MNDVIAIHRAWYRVDPAYRNEKSYRVMVLKPETTVSEIINWYETGINVIGKGDLIICEAQLEKGE